MLLGKQVRLRPVSFSDVDYLLQVENNTENWEVSGNDSSFSREDIQNYINSITTIQQDLQQRFIIENNEKQIVGTIDLFKYSEKESRVGVGVLIDNPFRKKGFAKESLQLVIRYCFTELNVKTIFCNIQPKNEASIKLFTKAGFKKILRENISKLDGCVYYELECFDNKHIYWNPDCNIERKGNS